MTATFNFEKEHIVSRLEERYYLAPDAAKEFLNNVKNTLETHTPDDWRFTESPTSRFFIMEEEKGAKFLGMSYRKSMICKDIVQELQENGNKRDSKRIIANLKDYSKAYLNEIRNPDLPIIHDIRTAYGKGTEGSISEEKHLYETSKGVVTHLLPITSKKIASRPNAIISSDKGDDGEQKLLVRQHLNWMSMEAGKREYYLFHPLTRFGVDKSSLLIYSLTENGDLKKEDSRMINYSAINDIKSPPGWLCNGYRGTDIIPEGYRTENYWKMPTCLDIRLTDLDFKERCFDKLEEKEQISNEERTELFFLRRIVENARAKIK